MCKTVNGLADIFVYLEKVGEEIDSNEWHLADARVDLNETEDEDIEAMLNSTLDVALSIADTRRKDSVQDTKFIKVRYRYAKGSKRHGKTGASSRDFCRMMHRTKKVFRKEDIHIIVRFIQLTLLILIKDRECDRTRTKNGKKLTQFKKGKIQKVPSHVRDN